MRNPKSKHHAISLFLVAIFCVIIQNQAFSSEKSLSNSHSNPTLGIGKMTNFSSGDSTFSIKISPRQKMMDEHTTLVLNLGMYKHLRYVKIYDLIGKNVFFQNLNYKPGTATYKINMAQLRPGIYFCRVYSDKGLVETRKLVHL